MIMKKQIVGFCVIAAVAIVAPKPQPHTEAGKDIDATRAEEYQAEERQSFDEYATNTIKHFVESGSDTPSPWYNDETDVMKDGILEENPRAYGDNPWVVVE